MTLNPDQFNELLKTAGRRSKMTVAGEKFISHDTLEDRGLSPYDKYSDAAIAGFVTVDGYGLDHTPMSGIRSVYTPDGKELEAVSTHKEGVAVIRQHRAGTHSSQQPYKPLGRPMGGYATP
jgi:hypothetical protein